jgi:GNAT superfamily N-acetyltransferase
MKAQQSRHLQFVRPRPRHLEIREVSALELVALITQLSELLVETVNGDAPLGFLAPITRSIAREYWISLIAEMEKGSRVLLIAFEGGIVVGSGQLALSQRTNSPHRAELQRLFVERASRGKGVGRLLMHALHEAARGRGRTLISLNTRADGFAREFYKSLGYTEVGVIRGWTIGPTGERYDHVELYLDIGQEFSA